MEPKNPPIEKENHLPNLHFSASKCEISRVYHQIHPKTPRNFDGPKKFWETRGSFGSPPPPPKKKTQGPVRYFLPHQFRGATKKTQPNIHQTVAICAGNENFPRKPHENVQTPWMVCVCTNMMCSNVHLSIYRHDCMNENHQFSFIINFLLNRVWLSMMT